ncbi:MAG TPA: hypothetical protein VJH92_00910 [Candidatus Nanoarchaeia archaeon]|nr:hypothetical protein [Candidatus Nanoarchaeia archaeon]
MQERGLEADRIKGQLYNQFYEDNKSLFEKDRQEFMRQQKNYVEKEFTNLKYKFPRKEDD